MAAPVPVIAIMDVGKTNKKLFLFDESYRIVFEQTEQFPEVADEDGFPCEDLQLLTAWVRDTYRKLSALEEYDVRAVNFSAYGASFVHVDAGGKPVAPLYNYLKPFSETLKEKFYTQYGGETEVSLQTASPVLGNLNSGMQLYRLKYERPDVFKKIALSLHLPQYLSYLLTSQAYSDITSIGCHTGLWDFDKNDYHSWVYAEGIDSKLAPVYQSGDVVPVHLNKKELLAGVGLHDSSAALIPYLASFKEPFILISTGTWCISLNPFNDAPLTAEELQQDCLRYMTYQGNPVKAARLFAGSDHEVQTKILATHFKVAVDYYKKLPYSPEIIQQLRQRNRVQEHESTTLKSGSAPSRFGTRELSSFSSYEDAYHQLISDIIVQQTASTRLVLKASPVKKIFVDGGFSKNPVYMNLLAAAFPGIEVFAASVAQATALGAALAIHHQWNSHPVKSDIIEIKHFAAGAAQE